MTPHDITAHDRLRLYLEQRKELGESELVLDSLPVEAVLKMIGAPAASGTTAAAPKSTSDARAPQRDATQSDGVQHDATQRSEPVAEAPVVPESRIDPNATTDWRATLSGLGSASERKPGVGQNKSKPQSDQSRERSTSASLPASPPVSSSDAPATVPPASSSTPPSVPSWLANLGLPSGLSAFPASDAATSDVANSQETFQQLATVITNCRACALGATALNAVPGEGNANADFVCVGEAPGQTEDETGRPFVGAAGDLLTKILGAIQLRREDVFICNVLKHRPPGNRNPLPDEVHACTPYLTRQLALLKPNVILAMGTFAAHTLLNTNISLGKLRGQVHMYQGIPLIVTYHPAALLRNEAWKRPAWDDVKLARRILDAARVASGDASRATSEPS